MKRDDLIKLLMELPADSEICTLIGDDILGDYAYDDLFNIEEHDAKISEKGQIWATYSNYVRQEDKPIKVWVIG